MALKDMWIPTDFRSVFPKGVLLLGDGAFGFNAMEFDTAVRHNLPVVGILGNDSAWGIDRQIQLGAGGGPLSGSAAASPAPTAGGS